MADDSNKLDEYWQALAGERSEERHEIREAMNDPSTADLVPLLHKLWELRAMIFETGAKELASPKEKTTKRH